MCFCCWGSEMLHLLLKMLAERRLTLTAWGPIVGEMLTGSIGAKGHLLAILETVGWISIPYVITLTDYSLQDLIAI